jgi:hypothetical protein
MRTLLRELTLPLLLIAVTVIVSAVMRPMGPATSPNALSTDPDHARTCHACNLPRHGDPGKPSRLGPKRPEAPTPTGGEAIAAPGAQASANPSPERSE